MDEVQFTKDDINGLAQLLSTLESLTDHQRALLLAIFAAAADRAKPTATPGGATLPAARIRTQAPAPGAGAQAALPDLKQQLLNAYIPGNDFTDIIDPSKSGKIAELPGR